MTSSVITKHRIEFQAILFGLGGIQFLNGLWATLSPTGFYGDFPLGRGWVEALPAYNEHLMRDVGGLFLATGLVLLAAAFTLERRLTLIALVSYLLFSVPHATWHLFNLDAYGTGDAIANAVTLVSTVVLPLWLLYRLSQPGAGVTAPRGAGGGDGNARIPGVPDNSRNPIVRASYLESRRRFGEVMDPMRVFAHHPRIMLGYSAMELATERSHRMPERLKHLGEMRAGMLAGCEWCCDFGSSLSRVKNVTEDDMRALPTYDTGDHFNEVEKLVLDYATGISRTPVDVSDELFDRLREHFDEAQLVELTNVISLENYRARFNWAFGIGSQGFAEGAFCVRPEGVAGQAATVA